MTKELDAPPENGANKAPHSLAAQYDRLYSVESKRVVDIHRWPTNRLEAVIRFADHGGRLLEIGCGDGEILEHLAPHYDAAMGIELSQTRAERARTRLQHRRNCTVLASSVEEFVEEHTELYDCIVCVDVIEHVVDPIQMIKAISHLCAPNAQLVISTPNIAFLPRRLELLLGRAPATSRPIHRDNGFARPIESTILLDGGHLHYFTFASLRDLLMMAGFKSVKSYGFGRFAPRLRQCWPSMLSGNAMLSGYYQGDARQDCQK